MNGDVYNNEYINKFDIVKKLNNFINYYKCGNMCSTNKSFVGEHICTELLEFVHKLTAITITDSNKE